MSTPNDPSEEDSALHKRKLKFMKHKERTMKKKEKERKKQAREGQVEPSKDLEQYSSDDSEDDYVNAANPDQSQDWKRADGVV